MGNVETSEVEINFSKTEGIYFSLRLHPLALDDNWSGLDHSSLSFIALKIDFMMLHCLFDI